MNTRNYEQEARENLRQEHEQQSGKKSYIIPVCHGEMAFASWEYQLWLENSLLEEREKQRWIPVGGFRRSFLEKVIAEVERAYAKHGKLQWGRHEFYAIFKEEVDEVWDDIKADADQAKLEKEIIQCAAMCLRYFETRDRYREPLPPAPSESAEKGE